MSRTACAMLFLSLWCSAGPAVAEEGKAPPTDLGRNAALTYWRAFGEIPEMTKEQLDIISRNPRDEAKSLSEQKPEIVAQWSEALHLMHEAADITQCDWGVDFEKDGPGTLLPQLLKAHVLTTGAAFRARYYWEEGRRKDAAEDLRAAVIMARQVGKDGLDSTIALLVQFRNESSVQETAAFLLTDRASADMVAQVLRDLVNAPAARLARNAVFSDKRAWISWFRHKYISDPAAAIEWMSDSAERQAELRALPPEKMLQSLDELGGLYNEIAAAEGLPFHDFLARKPALERKTMPDSPNVFAPIFLPALLIVREKEERYRVRWAMVRAAIEIRREGESALDKVKDPSDGKAFQYRALEGGMFELKSTLAVRNKQQEAMTFGHPPAKER